MKNIKIILLTVLIVTSCVVTYLNFLRYESFKIQFEMAIDRQYNKDYSARDIDWINSIKTSYPSLGLFTMPLLSQKGEYLLAKDSIFQAIELFTEAVDKNPFIMHPEANLADVFYMLGDFEKFENYTRYAFKNIPNNPLHYIYMVRLLKMQNKNDSIMYYFNQVEDILGIKDPQVYNITLAALVLDRDTIEKYGGEEIAKRAILRHPKKSKIIHDYIIYSRENIEKAAQKHEEAKKIFNEGKRELAINIFKEAIELHPNNQLYYDNMISASFENKDYQNIIKINEEYIEYFTDISPRISFFFAASLYFEEQYDDSCSLLNQLLESKSINIEPSLFPYCFNL